MSEIKDCTTCNLNGKDCFAIIGCCGERYDKWQPKPSETERNIDISLTDDGFARCPTCGVENVEQGRNKEHCEHFLRVDSDERGSWITFRLQPKPEPVKEDMGIRLPPDFGKDEGSENITASKFGRQFKALAHHGFVKKNPPLIEHILYEFLAENLTDRPTSEVVKEFTYRIEQREVAQRDADRSAVLLRLKAIISEKNDVEKALRMLITELAQ